MMELVMVLLMVQMFMGAFDTLYHHEFKVGLARIPTARTELVIHALRAVLYGGVFFGLAWFRWDGYWTLLLVTVVLVEVGLTLWDFVVEDRTRILPVSERITHTLLAINGGAAFGLLATRLPNWFTQPTALTPVDYGWASWFLTAGAAGVVLSGLRDAFAAWTVQRMHLQLGLDLGRHCRVLVSGGSGFIGSALVRELLAAGHEVTVLSRRPVATAVLFGGRVRTVARLDELSSHTEFDAVVNLAGAPVVGLPWTKRRRAVIAGSRFEVTRELLDFVRRARRRPGVWVQASAVGYYGPQRATPVDESASAGSGFAAELCDQWEKQTEELAALSIRRVVLRFGLVFGRSGGSLPMMLLSYRLGAGVVLGNGAQYMAWIHIEDLLRLIALSIKSNTMCGVINAVAPDTPTYREFATVAGRVLQRPVWLSVPAGLLRTLLGEMASMFVDGPKITPNRLLQSKFDYHFPQLRGALMDLA